MTALIYLTGIAVFALVIYLTLELAPATPTGRLAETLTPADGVVLNGWRRSLSPLDKPVSKWTPAGLLRQTRADLYWAQIGDRWNDWNEVQFTSLRVALAVAGFGLGMVATGEPVFALIGGLVGFQYPAMAMGGIARRYRRLFISQLPEYVQLVSAQMSANVSMEEALRRTSQAQSLAGKWMRRVLQMAQGRDLIEQMQREAQEAHLPELIGMSVQLEFIRRGTAQQELMGQLATSIAADYIGSAEQRAEKGRFGTGNSHGSFLFSTLPSDTSGCHWLADCSEYGWNVMLANSLKFLRERSGRLRDLAGFAFFAFAALVSIAAAWDHPSVLAWLYASHNFMLAFFYARRQPAKRYDRTGLWLGMIAAFLPTFSTSGSAPWYLLVPALAGYGLILWSLVTLGTRFGIAPADRGLTCQGPYRILRHPMYLGELVFRVAMVFCSPNLLFAGLMALTLVVIQCWRILREEKMIDGYTCYTRVVPWRLVPGLW